MNTFKIDTISITTIENKMYIKIQTLHLSIINANIYIRDNVIKNFKMERITNLFEMARKCKLYNQATSFMKK